MPLSSSMSTAKTRKSSFILPTTACPKQSSTKTVCTDAYLQEELISCLTHVANSEKVRHPSCIEYLWLPSRAEPSGISFPPTFTCDGAH
ncbi:hypothetical protein TNCV_1765181 [Trichonephila clavipes]|nr:hypothetical protein TNCV_1765181 [Trichonephila clavipes]